jgi:spore maturation protein A
MGNAATPFGLKAMERLQQLNHNRTTASKSMITFLALNTACPCLFPTMIIGLRVAAGSRNPSEIIGTTLGSTMAALATALIVDRIMRRREGRRHA